MSNDKLTAALRYALWVPAGVLPCVSGGKEPMTDLVSDGVKNATTNLDIIQKWWELKPEANIGVAGGNGLLFVDLDLYKNANARQDLETLIGCELPPTWTEQTPGYEGIHGQHLSYTVPIDQELNGCDPLNGVELRYTNRYIVVSPSSTAEGQYFVTDNQAPVPAPEGLLELLRNAPATGVGRGVPDDEPLPTDNAYLWRFLEDAYKERPLEKGKRYIRVNWFMKRCAKEPKFGNLSLGQIYTALRQFPPAVDKDREIRGWLDSDFRRFQAQDWPEIARSRLSDDEQFWTSRPELEHIRTFARSRIASPWAVLGVVLARVVTSCHPSLVLPPSRGTIASLNLFIGNVGDSGTGKGIAFGVARDAFVWCEDVKTEKPGSGEGLAHAYMRRPKPTTENPFPDPVQHTTSVLFTIPEIDTFDALTKRSGSTLMPELRSAYMGEQLGFQYADPTKRLPVPEHKYRLCIVAGIQPQRSGVLLNDADGGTPQRFVWLPATDPDAPDDLPTEPEPMPWKCPYQPPELISGGIVRTEHKHQRVDVHESARTAIVKAAQARNKGKGDALDSHALLTRLKVSVALALLNGRINVSADDWSLANLVMKRSDHTRASVIAEMGKKVSEENQSRGRAEAARQIAADEVKELADIKKTCQAVENQLSKLSVGEYITIGSLAKKLNSRYRRNLEPALEALELTRRIERHATEPKVRLVNS